MGDFLAKQGLKGKLRGVKKERVRAEKGDYQKKKFKPTNGEPRKNDRKKPSSLEKKFSVKVKEKKRIIAETSDWRNRAPWHKEEKGGGSSSMREKKAEVLQRQGAGACKRTAERPPDGSQERIQDEKHGRPQPHQDS